MPGPITHVVLANRLLPRLAVAPSSVAELLAGMVFPDIRYLGTVSRGATHRHGLSLSGVPDESPFVAGMNLHSLIDEMSDRYFDAVGLPSLLPPSPHATQAFKLLADDILYDDFGTWTELCRSLETVRHPAGCPADDEEFRRWFGILGRYFTHHPSAETRRALMLDIGFNADQAGAMEKLVVVLGRDEKIRHVIKGLSKDVAGISRPLTRT
jgi:hypothetical protein